MAYRSKDNNLICETLILFKKKQVHIISKRLQSHPCRYVSVSEVVVEMLLILLRRLLLGLLLWMVVLLSIK